MNFSRPFSVFSPNTVSVRLYSPAVSTSTSTSFFLSSRCTLGTWAATPMDPTTAKGAARILSATAAIR